jgi:hypothetical protein
LQYLPAYPLSISTAYALIKGSSYFIFTPLLSKNFLHTFLLSSLEKIIAGISTYTKGSGLFQQSAVYLFSASAAFGQQKRQ